MSGSGACISSLISVFERIETSMMVAISVTDSPRHSGLLPAGAGGTGVALWFVFPNGGETGQRYRHPGGPFAQESINRDKVLVYERA